MRRRQAFGRHLAERQPRQVEGGRAGGVDVADGREGPGEGGAEVILGLDAEHAGAARVDAVQREPVRSVEDGWE